MKSKEEIKSKWRTSSNTYYSINSKKINLWKYLRIKAKRRGIIIPKLKPGQLVKNSPRELVRLLNLPSDIISELELFDYESKQKLTEVKSEHIVTVKIEPIHKQCTCNPESYLCTCGAI